MRIQVRLSSKEICTFSIAHRKITAEVAEFEITHHMILFEKLIVNDESISLSNIREQSEYELKDNNKTLIIEWAKTDKDGENWSKQISEILKQYLHGWNVGSVSSFKALKILKDFQIHQNRELKKYPLVSVADLKESFYYLNIVLCSYGWQGLNTFGHGNTYLVDFLRPKSNEKIIREHLHMPKEHVLVYSERVKAFKPAYFAIYDKNINAVVVVVRGTMSVQDAITDFVCNYYPWKNGYVHEGMYKGALRVFEEIKSQIKVWVTRFNTSKVVFSGHSMGGCIAVLLSRFALDEYSHLSISAYSYGAPPTVTASLLPMFTHVISVVNHNDFVSRISYGAMVKLREHIETINKHKNDPKVDLYEELGKSVEPRFPQVSCN
eukprot:NODE_299_length_11430_cov_0.261054.p2 type:complete len:379 gc:universal NODE_299_length_11430_cov_0.261054:3504-2368(-)